MKLLLTLAALLTTYTSFAQMSAPKKEPAQTIIGKVVNFGTFVGQLSFAPDPLSSDTLYTFSFRNYQYTQIESIVQVQFVGKALMVDTLYATLKTVFLPENKKDKDFSMNFTLGKDVVAISLKKSMGYPALMFQTTQGYGLFTEKQLNKLFGKN